MAMTSPAWKAPALLDRPDQIATRKHLNRPAMLTVLIGEALIREERAAA